MIVDVQVTYGHYTQPIGVVGTIRLEPDDEEFLATLASLIAWRIVHPAGTDADQLAALARNDAHALRRMIEYARAHPPVQTSAP